VQYQPVKPVNPTVNQPLRGLPKAISRPPVHVAAFYNLNHNKMKKTMNLDIPRQLELLCSLLETSPEKLLQGFIHDLCRTQHSNGSDERLLAGEYFLPQLENNKL
jgi:hypothetical protein